MRDTQTETYKQIQPTLPGKRKIVLDAIEYLQMASLIQISEYLGWPINSVSGRVTELSKAGLVKDSGLRTTNPSGKQAILWSKTQGEN